MSNLKTLSESVLRFAAKGLSVVVVKRVPAVLVEETCFTLFFSAWCKSRV